MVVKLSFQYRFVLVWVTIAILNDTKQYKIVQEHSVVIVYFSCTILYCSVSLILNIFSSCVMSSALSSELSPLAFKWGKCQWRKCVGTKKLSMLIKLSYQYWFVLVWVTIVLINDTKRYKIVQLHSVVSEFSHVAFCIAQYLMLNILSSYVFYHLSYSC